MAVRKGLGRGLGALINDNAPKKDTEPEGGAIVKLPVDQIRRNTWQPRKTFDAEALAELAESIRERGVLQPLLVRKTDSGYELIAGERRLRASIEAELKEVPVIVMEATDNDSMELALIENLQREDLNPLEEAEGYHVLSEHFGMTQEQIAMHMGRARATVANALRLLSLPDEVKRLLAGGTLSAGHAKLLTGLESISEQILLARRTVEEGLSVRALEALLKRAQQAPRKPRASRADVPSSHLNYLCDRMHAHFGTGVRITPSRTYANGKKGRGLIEIDFYSNDDLDRILALLGISAD